MMQVEIINPSLQMPHMLISAYEVSFNNYLSVETRKNKLQNLLSHLQSEQAVCETSDRILVLEMNQKNISENLRYLDELIHNYIKTHQQ